MHLHTYIHTYILVCACMCRFPRAINKTSATFFFFFFVSSGLGVVLCSCLCTHHINESRGAGKSGFWSFNIENFGYFPVAFTSTSV